MGEEEHAPLSMQDLLLSYAWCVELTLEHLHRLHYANRSKRTVQYALERLTDAGWIERHERHGTSRPLHSEKASTHSVPTRLPAVWSLTMEGHAQIKGLEAYPAKETKTQYPAKAGKARGERLREHDLLLSELVVELIERGRERGLSGIFVGRELRLSVERPRPLMDALLLLHFHDIPCAPNVVPWTKDKATTQEQTLRYAVELDTGSEAIATVVKKAEEYAAIIRPDNRAWFDWWYPRYGARPFVLLVLPENKSRFETVFEGWARAWPEGAWAMTTPGRLREDRWVVYDAQTDGRAEWSVFPLPKPPDEASTPLAPAVRPIPTLAVPPTQNPTAREGQILEDEQRQEAEEALVEVPRPPEPLPIVRQQPVAPLTLALAAVASGQIAVTLPRRTFLPAPSEEDYRQADHARWRRRYGLSGMWLLLALHGLWAGLWTLAGWVASGYCPGCGSLCACWRDGCGAGFVSRPSVQQRCCWRSCSSL